MAEIVPLFGKRLLTIVPRSPVVINLYLLRGSPVTDHLLTIEREGGLVCKHRQKGAFLSYRKINPAPGRENSQTLLVVYHLYFRAERLETLEVGIFTAGRPEDDAGAVALKRISGFLCGCGEGNIRLLAPDD